MYIMKYNRWSTQKRKHDKVHYKVYNLVSTDWSKQCNTEWGTHCSTQQITTYEVHNKVHND